LNDKYKSVRFKDLEIDLSEVELIEEEWVTSGTPGGNKNYHVQVVALNDCLVQFFVLSKRFLGYNISNKTNESYIN
jgi:hypothetical protein